jgi:hypothetical protein
MYLAYISPYNPTAEITMYHNKMKTQITTIAEQFQNPIEKSQNEAKLIP